MDCRGRMPPAPRRDWPRCGALGDITVRLVPRLTCLATLTGDRWRVLVAVGRVQFRTAGRKATWTSWPLPPQPGWPLMSATGASAVSNCSSIYLARAERHNTALNAVVAWQIDGARDRARAADAALARGEVWGPLHGVPMTVKESFNVTGLPTHLGQPAVEGQHRHRKRGGGRAAAAGRRDHLRQDQRAADAAWIRRATTTSTGRPTTRGTPRAGRAARRAGKAAALAAGLSALGAGSDIAGSLRNPAHYCGVYGHKPSWGLIPTRGHSPTGALTPTDISVVGPMARYAEDIDLAMRVLAGPD